MYLKPVCVPCQRFFYPKKNGYDFLEGMPTVQGALPGTAEPENWAPYKLWRGDLWACKGCGAEIVVGVAGGPIAEHYQDNFKQALLHFPPQLKVNDC